MTRHITILCMVFWTGVVCVAQAQAFLIHQHQIGPVSIGQSAQSLYEAFGPDSRRLVDLGFEGFLTPALEITLPGSTFRAGVTAELAARNGLFVSRITVTDPGARTEKGIGVGSTVAQLRAAYRVGGLLSGEGAIALRVDELSASFVLDEASAGGTWVIPARNPDDIPDLATISAILLTQ